MNMIKLCVIMSRTGLNLYQTSMYNAATRHAFRQGLIQLEEDVIGHYVNVPDDIEKPSTVILVELSKKDENKVKCFHMEIYSIPDPKIISSVEDVHMSTANISLGNIIFTYISDSFAKWLRLAYSYKSTEISSTETVDNV